jgi:DNA (cytosine-5)-methyltransferase 1
MSKKELTIVETFVGCGGSHCGFKKDFKTVFVNDIWETSLKTLKKNNKELKEEQVICKDINKLCEDELLKTHKIKEKELSLLIGGVVCKGFSLAGVRNPYDDRNYLYIAQLKLVEKFKPQISIIENVPGMQTMKILAKKDKAPYSNELKNNYDINESIEKLCIEIDGIIKEHKINRGKIIAINKKISELENDGNNEDELKILKDTKKKLTKEKNTIETKRKKYENKLDKYKYSVLEDIHKKYEEIGYKVHIKKLKVSNYGGYTNRIRLIIVAVRNDIKKEWEWPDYTNIDNEEKKKKVKEITKNIESLTKENEKLKKKNKENECEDKKENKKVIGRNKKEIEELNKTKIFYNNLQALLTVKDAFKKLNIEPENINDPKLDKDNVPMNHKKATVEKFKKILSNQKSGSFSSRGTSHRLDYNKPAPTLVPGHSSFQIHPTENRSITVREGAIITGFSNNYNFVGSHSDRCMQIGNAIPVQLAEALSKSVKKMIS